MEADEVAERQKDLIKQLVALAPAGWKRLFLNYEMQDSGESVVADGILFAVKKSLFGKIERVNLRVNIAERQLLNKLGLHFMSKAGQKHLTLDLLIRDDGAFKTYVGYEPPERLGGNLTAVKRHLMYAAEDAYLRQVE